ncbi:MAG: hypothetical protein J0I54_03880 [Bosea sp.]|uniref:hypothetical protein n=1 Tax=unclassified Bosea (in: a-proteobacteria) TaxID=2653178 RepID=UPI00095938C9|nr:MULTISPECIES: hypothetical protein [unclassified Bosea (in: a-proteobacteria)]MBN9455747.1 hypothetical protein [Bosea sp. (in: a-proteobacteria)]OJV07980.1 MAG: hypothetical protein BGO20_08815 [Bosea sp. 67-29]
MTMPDEAYREAGPDERDDGLPDVPTLDVDMAAHVVMERATFPPSRPSLALAAGRRFVAERAPILRSSFGSAVLLGLRFVQARLISVWGLIVAAWFCPPAVFAAFAVFSAAVNFVSTASLLRLEAVFFRSNDPVRLGLAFRLASVVGAAFLALTGLVLLALALTGWVAPAVAFFFLVSLAGRSVLRLIWSEATAEGDFRAIGNSNIVQAVVQPVIMLVLIGIFGPKALALFMADACGHLLAAAYLLRRRHAALLPLVQPRLWSVESLVAAAYRWRDAPRALLPAALLAYGFSIAPILALPYASNALLAAHVALAMRLLDMPAQMFGTVSTPLALNRLRSYAGARRHFWVRALTIGLIAASIALFAASGLVGYLADGLLGGSKWEGVGDVIAIMSLFYCGIALVGPLQEIATLSRQPLWQVLTNALALLAMVGVMLWYGALTPALLVAIGTVSVARTLVHVVFIWLHLGDAGNAASRDFTAMGARP